MKSGFPCLISSGQYLFMHLLISRFLELLLASFANPTASQTLCIFCASSAGRSRSSEYAPSSVRNICSVSSSGLSAEALSETFWLGE